MVVTMCCISAEANWTAAAVPRYRLANFSHFHTSSPTTILKVMPSHSIQHAALDGRNELANRF